MEVAVKEIGIQIQKYREKMGMKQEKFAEIIDLSPNYLSAIERGVKNPSFDTFLRIVNGLGVSSDDILVDVLEVKTRVKCSQLEERLEVLPVFKKDKVLRILEVLIEEEEK